EIVICADIACKAARAMNRYHLASNSFTIYVIYLYCAMTTISNTSCIYFYEAAKNHLTQRIENLDGKMDQQVEISKLIRSEVNDAREDISQIGYDLDSLSQLVSGLNGKIMTLEEKQDLTNLGVWYLCNKADGNKKVGQGTAIHGSDGKVEASMKASTRSCWLNILHEVNVLSKKGIDLKKFMRFKVGNGENIMFWEDTWNEGRKFKCRFPRMYALESCKSISVGRKLAQSSLIDSFRRSPRGGAEQQQYNDLEDWLLLRF
nr:RNA-directed DNA polymerase, eukaryota, reverse transcriptase zinc-binding domain protein [Tanacetum cinerariifolium]